MAVNLSPVGGVAGQFFDNNGDPLVGGKLFTYAAGTTTPQVTYLNSSGVTPNSNPIILNGGGRVSAEIWLTDGLVYKFVLYSSTDQLIGSWDGIIGINSNFVNFTTSEEIQIATAGQTVFTLTTMQYQPGANNLVVYVDGVNQVEGGSYSYVETDATTVTFTAGLHVGAVVKFVSAEFLTTAGANADTVIYQPAVGPQTTVKIALDELFSYDFAEKTNYNWMGFFRTWQNGHAFRVGEFQRDLGASGATFARLNFVDDRVTCLHVKGTYQPDAIRISRDATNTNTASATMVMNLTQAETRPLLGKNICLQFHALKSSAWTGSQVNVRLQYSKEPEQPIVRSDGAYTNGQTILAQDDFTLATAMPAENEPFFITGLLPADAIQVAIVVTVPFSGTAPANDYVDFEGMFLTIGLTPSTVIPELFEDLLVKAQSRYQSTYPYSFPRGTGTKAGSLRVAAVGTSGTSAVIANVRFSPTMAITPQVFMQSPLSGTENRWENENTGVFVNGLPFNLSNTGVTLQNNGAVSAGDVLLCHWTAQAVF